MSSLYLLLILSISNLSSTKRFENSFTIHPKHGTSSRSPRMEEDQITPVTIETLSQKIEKTNLLQYEFKSNNNLNKREHLYSLTLVHRNRSAANGEKDEPYFYLGAVDHVYRLELRKTPLNGYQKEDLITSDDEQYNLEFVQTAAMKDGPHNTSKYCLANITETTDEPEQGCVRLHNQIRHLFYNKRILIACGTTRCGLCTGLSFDSNKKIIIDHPINAMESDSEHDCRVSMRPYSFITSLDSSLVFIGNRQNATDVIYTAFSNDGRDAGFQPPFISVRDLTQTGFTNNQRSSIKLRSKNYYFRFITGFSHNHFAYFLFMECQNQTRSFSRTFYPESHCGESSLDEPVLRLGRICENDLSPLFSYMETELRCSESFTVAQAAHLSVHVLNDGPATLLIGFNDRERNRSAVCSYRMDKLEEHFYEGFVDCNREGYFTGSIKKLDDKAKCGRIHTDGDLVINGTCPYTHSNRYINIEKPFNSSPIIFIENDQITSLASLIKTYNNPHKHIQHVLVGTGAGLLHKFSIKNGKFSNNMTTVHAFSTNLSEPLITQQQISFDDRTSTFYLLSANRLIRFPIESCGLFSSCQSCFRTIVYRHETLCHWDQNRCVLKKITKINNHKSSSCPAQVFRFEPKAGPKNGRTNITFYGEDFGFGNQKSYSNNLSITIDGRRCDVLERNNTVATCQLEGKSNSEEGKIIFEAIDSLHFSTRGYDIRGEANLKESFKFLTPNVRGIHPHYGPFNGGTKLLILGQYLNIGNEALVRIGEQPCNVLTRNSEYIVCSTSKYEMNVEEKILKKIKVEIDNSEVERDSSNKSENYEKLLQILQHKSSKRIRRNTLSQFLPFNVPYERLPAEELFSFRFRNSILLQKRDPEFRTHFLYKKNPKLDRIEKAAGLNTSQTTMEFSGEHFDSVFYPELELVFEPNVRVLCPCEIKSNTTKKTFPSGTLSCLLPSLTDIKIQHPNIRIQHHSEPLLSGHYVLHLDDYNWTNDFKFFDDPTFDPIDDVIIVSDKVLELKGRYLYGESPFQIKVDGKYLCEKITTNQFKNNVLSCRFRISDQELDDLIGKPLNITAIFGPNNVKHLGQMSFKSHKSSFLSWIMFIVLLVLLIILVGVSYLYVYVRSNLPKQNGPYSSIEMNHVKPGWKQDITQHLRKFFTQHFGDRSDEVFENLQQRNVILADANRLELIEELGEGEYGLVYKGIIDKDLSKLVAVKISKDFSWIKLLFKEMEVMMNFDHPNVLSLIYMTIVEHPVHESSHSVALIMPFMHHNDLQSFIKNNQNSPKLGKIINYSIQIAEGMNYLSQQNFVHRDLAARNCLLDAYDCVKIADFGLTRVLNEDRECYTAQNEEQRLPIKWMALESLKTFEFTTKSDVWSYGVLGWELYTRGRTPYEELPNVNTIQSIVEKLESGYRFPKPHYVPHMLWLILLKCWLVDPRARPTFEEIIRDYREVVALFQEKRANLNSDVKQIGTPYQTGSTLSYNFADEGIQNKLNENYESVKNQIRRLKQIDERTLFQCYDNENLEDDYGQMVTTFPVVSSQNYDPYLTGEHQPLNSFDPQSMTALKGFSDQQSLVYGDMNDDRSLNPPPYLEATRFESVTPPPISQQPYDYEMANYPNNGPRNPSWKLNINPLYTEDPPRSKAIPNNDRRRIQDPRIQSEFMPGMNGHTSNAF